MFQYSFDDDTTKKINDSTTKSKGILEQFSDVDNKYNTLTKVTTEPKFEKLEYSEPSEDEVNAKAESKLLDYKNASISSIQDNFDTKLSQVQKEKNDLVDSTNKSIESLNARYNDVKEDTKNDAIKRGLARSSIVVNKLNNLDLKKLNDFKELQKSTDIKIDELASLENSLEAQKQSALNSFNISYAVKLQDEINSIKNEIEKNKQAVIKYNNEVEGLIAKWQKQQQDDEFSKVTNLAKIASEYGISVFDILKQNEKYALAKEYFASIPKDEALAELSNNGVYKNSLGRVNFDKLIEEIQNR